MLFVAFTTKGLRMRVRLKKTTGIKRFQKIVGKGSIMDQTNWRKHYDPSATKFDDVQKLLFLNLMKINGRKYQAAQAAGVTWKTVLKHLDNDPEFNEAFISSRGLYADRVKETVEKVAIEGISEPLIGGIKRDKIVAYKKVFATNVLIAEMKRTDADYKDRQAIDLNVKAGVLVVPAGMSIEEWEKSHAKDLENTC